MCLKGLHQAFARYSLRQLIGIDGGPRPHLVCLALSLSTFGISHTSGCAVFPAGSALDSVAGGPRGRGAATGRDPKKTAGRDLRRRKLGLNMELGRSLPGLCRFLQDLFKLGVGSLGPGWVAHFVPRRLRVFSLSFFFSRIPTEKR